MTKEELEKIVLENKSEVVDILSNHAKKERYVKKNLTIPESLDSLAKEANLNFSECLRNGILDALKNK